MAMSSGRIRINEAITWLDEHANELKNKAFAELGIKEEVLGDVSSEVLKYAEFMLMTLREMHRKVQDAIPIAQKRAERVKLVRAIAQIATTLLSGATVLALGGTDKDIPRITAIGTVLAAILSLSIEWLDGLGYGSRRLSFEAVTHELIDASYEIKQLETEISITLDTPASEDRIRDMIGRGNTIARKMNERIQLILGSIGKLKKQT
jgi:hypothetical protein